MLVIVKPPDEIRAFETRASRQPKKIGIPGLPPPAEPKKKAAKPVAQELKHDVNVSLTNLNLGDSKPVTKRNLGDVKPVAEEVVTEKDPKKRLKALKKKLRDIVELSTKQVSELSVEQKEKLSKKESIEAEIESLAEFD